VCRAPLHDYCLYQQPPHHRSNRPSALQHSSG